MSVTVKVESANFALALERFKKEVQGDLRKYVVDQSGLFLSELIKRTPPNSKSQGQKAVKRDLGRAVKVIKEQRGTYGTDFSDIENPRLKQRLNQLVRSKNHAELETVLRKLRKDESIKVRPFSERLHKQARQSGGRVLSDKKTYTLDDQKWTKYRAKLVKRVGLVKYGWMGAVRRLRQAGANVRVSGSWIEKKRDLPSGTSRWIRTQNGPIFEMKNPYGYVRNYKATVNSVLNIRARKMHADIRRILRGGAHRYGIGTR